MKDEKTKPEEKTLVTASGLSQMTEDIRNRLMETEINPLKERLDIAIASVHPSALDIRKPVFLAPTKEQIMNMIAPGCKNERMLSLFMETCKHLQLDPIKREVYFYNQGGDDWVIKVDYKVPIAIAQRDPDYMHFKSRVEYLAEEKRPEKPPKELCPVCKATGKYKDKPCHGCNGDGWIEPKNLNPHNILGAYCQIYKRSWVRLANEVGNPSLAYKEHFVPWDTWRRTKRNGDLQGTWKEKGHFYIEKTAIDHCFRLVYSELLGALPPSTGYDVIKEEELTVEAQIIKNHKEEEYQKNKPKVDADFSEASREQKPAGEEPEKPTDDFFEKGKSDLITEADRRKLFAIGGKANYNREEIKAHLHLNYGISSTKEIKREWFEQICEEIKNGIILHEEPAK